MPILFHKQVLEFPSRWDWPEGSELQGERFFGVVDPIEPILGHVLKFTWHGPSPWVYVTSTGLEGALKTENKAIFGGFVLRPVAYDAPYDQYLFVRNTLRGRFYELGFRLKWGAKRRNALVLRKLVMRGFLDDSARLYHQPLRWRDLYLVQRIRVAVDRWRRRDAV